MVHDTEYYILETQNGERWDADDETVEHLRKLARQDKPFFLQYWPVIPLYNPRTTVDQYTTPNGGTFVESMKQLDGWIGEILAEMNTLSIADNTVVVVMGDNGHFTKYSPGSGGRGISDEEERTDAVSPLRAIVID